jgi:p-cumate 2,3-dioxygenase alpha subunit
MRAVSSSCVLDDSSRGIFRVRRPAYSDPAVFRRELATIFSRCWLYLGHASEIAEPDAFLTRTIANRSLIFLRDSSGVVRAYSNSCPHRGATLCRAAKGKAKSFACMYHGWVFRSDGRLVHQPGGERYAPRINDDGALDLARVPRLESYRDFYFVNFDASAVDLVTYLGNAKEYVDLVADQAAESMRVVPGTQEYVIRANWKLLAENSIDIYHGASLHPTYLAYLQGTTGALNPLAGLGGTARDLGGGHGVVEYRGPWGRPIAQWIPMWGDEAKAEIEAIRQSLAARLGDSRAERIALTSRNLLIFPNLVINDIGAITIRTFQPSAPDAMLVDSWALAPAEETEPFLARRLDNYLEFLGPAGFATPDDIEAIESCQRGYAGAADAVWSDLSKGMTFASQDWEDEGQLRAFWRRWREIVEDGEHGERGDAV